jgi:hypothetical protein
VLTPLFFAFDLLSSLFHNKPETLKDYHRYIATQIYDPWIELKGRYSRVIKWGLAEK